MRVDNDMVKHLVREFLSNWRTNLWNFVDSRVQEALVDSYVMDHVRMANAVDADRAMTPSDLMNFRDRLLAAMKSDAKCRGRLVGLEDLS